MNGFTPNNNTNVIRMLSEAIRKCNKSRNRILMGAVILCILTLTFVFGSAYGKINAEYMKNRTRKQKELQEEKIENNDNSSSIIFNITNF